MKLKILSDSGKKKFELSEVCWNDASIKAIKECKGAFSGNSIQLTGLWNPQTNKIVCQVNCMHLNLAITYELINGEQLKEGWFGFRLTQLRTASERYFIKYGSDYFKDIPKEYCPSIKDLLTNIIENDPVDGVNLTLMELRRPG